MKLRNDGEQAGYSWERPQQQPLTVEVLHSNERADLTAVFGTSTPPSGPSGALRRLAFRYSESSYGHWLPLVLADRLSVVGGVLGDRHRGPHRERDRDRPRHDPRRGVPGQGPRHAAAPRNARRTTRVTRTHYPERNGLTRIGSEVCRPAVTGAAA